MKKLNRALLVLLALTLILMPGCGSRGGDSSPADADNEQVDYAEYTELEVGDDAPLFTAEYAGSESGTFDMADQGGKVVLINFWATWCPPCCEEMPAFEMLDADYGDEVAIIAVNVGEDRETVEEFLNENGYTFPVALDEDGTVSALYPTDGIPFTIIVGKDGKIKALYVGASSAEVQYEEYKKAIEEALNE